MSEDWAKWVEPEERVTTRDILAWGSLFGPPRYARETITQPVEPYYSQHKALRWEISETLTNDEYGNWSVPDPEWWTPTPAMQAKLDQLADLESKRFAEVPNPDYDPLLAEEWRQRRHRPTVIETGQSYNP